nr:MAG TPA: hypothetical protein [Caudoviricetes sp.]
MLHHYITKYWDVDEGALYVEAWLQLNVFGYCFCFSRRKERITAEALHLGDDVEEED